MGRKDGGRREGVKTWTCFRVGVGIWRREGIGAWMCVKDGWRRVREMGFRTCIHCREGV